VDLQDCKTIIYCALIIAIINFRTKGIMGEYELSLDPVRKLIRKAAERLRAGRSQVMSKCILKTTNLRKNFGGVVAVKNFSFEIDEGQIIAIIGPNGAGKTTIFNLISKIHEPDGGAIAFDGQDSRKSPRSRSPGWGFPDVPERAPVHRAERHRQR
jgi:ABC-type multidrug transport system fused ATPase/permease subunit